MKKILLLNLFLFTTILFAQTGPGGVGNTDGTSDLVLWLDANKIVSTDGTVTSWADQSGYNHNFTAGTGATFTNSLVNNYPGFSFDGTSDYFQNTYSATLNTDDFSVFVADKTLSNNQYKAVISNRDSPPQKGFILYAVPNNNRWQFWNGSTTGWRTSNSNISTVGSWSSQLIRYNATTDNHRLFIDDNKEVENTYSFTKNGTRPYRIGAGKNENHVPNYYYEGDIGEVIQYKIAINETKKRIVNNYLAAKYDFTLETNDYYTQDKSDNGNFDHNVAGIGQYSSVDNHTDSQGTGIVSINTPSALADGDYLFWGEETKDPVYTTTTTTDYLERLDRKWRVNKVNNLGTVTVSVATNDLVLSGMLTCATATLIVSSDPTFATKTTYNMTEVAGIQTATSVNFTDGDYFTFEYIDTIVVDVTQFYNGSGASNVPDSTDSCYTLLVKGTANGLLPLTEDAHVNNIIVENGGKLIVNSGLELKVADGIDLTGEIRLLGDSQLVQTHTGTSLNTGSGKLYKDVLSGLTNVHQSSYFSPPVTTTGSGTYTVKSVMKDGTTALAVSGTPSDITFVTGHDGAAGTPISISNFWLNKLIDALYWYANGTAIDENTSFNPAEGYNMKSTGANTQNYTFVGKPNDGDYAIAVTAGKSSLIGNPYPSALNADTFISNNGSLFSNKLYFWDGKTDFSATHVRSDYTDSYATYASGVGTSINGGAAPTNIIAIGQAFFVDTTLGGNIVFNNAQRISGSGPFFSRTNPFPILRIGFEFVVDNNGNTFQRQLAVAFRGLTNDYDAGIDTTMAVFQPTDISLKVDNYPGEFVITGREDYLENAIEIPLHVRLDQQRDVTFRIDGIENFTPNNIYLKDANTNMYYDLANPISLNLPTGDYQNRFSITFRNNTASIEDNITKNTIEIIDLKESISVKSINKKMINSLNIYNTLGQNIFSKKVNSIESNISVNIEKGQVLLISILLNNGVVITEKIIKK